MPKRTTSRQGMSVNDISASDGVDWPALIQCRLPGLSFVTGGQPTLLATIDQWLATNTSQKISHTIGFVNPHVYNSACEHPSVQTFLDSADLVCVDGIGIKWALLFTEAQWIPRVVAEHLFNALLVTRRPLTTAVLIGAEPGEVETAARAMNNSSRGLHITSCIDGFQPRENYRRFLQQNADCDLVLIGAGSPKSENIALITRAVCKSAVIFHIGGGTLNTWAGTKRRGPALVSRLGFEWLHRILFEPHTRHRYTRGFYLYIRNLLSQRLTANSASKGDMP